MEFDLILCSSDLKTHRIIYSLRATTTPSEPCTKFSKYKSKGSKILTTGLQIKRVLEQPLIIKPVGHKIHSGQHLGKKSCSTFAFDLVKINMNHILSLTNLCSKFSNSKTKGLEFIEWTKLGENTIFFTVNPKRDLKICRNLILLSTTNYRVLYQV